MNLGPEVLLQLGILSIQDSLTSKFELVDGRLCVNNCCDGSLLNVIFKVSFGLRLVWIFVRIAFFPVFILVFLIVLEFLLTCNTRITLLPFLEYASPAIIRCQFFAGVRGCL